MEKAPPTVSVIVTSLNAERTIADCLSSLFKQDYGDFEVILVDGGSSDGTVGEARRAAGECGNFHLIIDDSARTPARGRNIGAKAAVGRLLAFTDSDCTPEPDWISRLASPRNWAEDTGAVGGKTVFTRVPDGGSMLSALHGALETRLGSGGSAEFFEREARANVRSLPSCNVMYRAEVFARNGGFDEWLRYCEDYCLNARVRRDRCKLSYIPQAIVHHQHRSSTSRFLRWIYDYGRGRASAMKKDLKAVSISVMLLGILAVMFFSLAVFHVLPIGVLLYSTFAVYCAAAFTSAFFNAEKRSTNILLYFAGYFLIHFSYAAGLVVGLLSPPTTITFLSRSAVVR